MKKYICEQCQKTFNNYPSNRRGKRIFCSLKCKGIFQSIIAVGKNSFHWKGGRTRTQINRDWVSKNKDRKQFINHRRESRLFNNGGSHTYEEWINLKKIYKNMCLSCKKKEPDIKLTEDHIIPLFMGGSDSIDNIQPLCMSCNCRKRLKTINFRKDWLIL